MDDPHGLANDPAKPFRATARVDSIRFALRGIHTMLRTQHNAWIHGAATLATVAAGLLLSLNAGEWIALTLTLMAVWSAEALNTALEALCDVASPETHPLIARAKDVAAGAVLISAIGAAVIGALLFAPKLANHLL